MKSQHGIALVLVLWVLLLLTIITGSFALMARMDRLEANSLLSGTQARFSAEAAINLAALALRDPDDEKRMLADGRVYEQVIDGILVEVSAIDERGKVDINATEEITLSNMFIGLGMEVNEAEMLAAAVLDWRDQDELERVNGAEDDAYYAAGLELGPANRPFMMTEELLQVMGMPYELYRKLEPGITVFSRSGNPDPAFAPVEIPLEQNCLMAPWSWNKAGGSRIVFRPGRRCPMAFGNSCKPPLGLGEHPVVAPTVYYAGVKDFNSRTFITDGFRN
jgi:general secretion pathway protein K